MIIAKSKNCMKSQYFELLYSIILVSVLCIFGNGSNIFSIIVLLGFVPLILNPEYLIGPLFFATTWSSYILVANSQSLARYLVFFFIFGVWIKVIKSKEKMKVDFWFIAIVFSILLSLVLSIWGIYGYTSMPVAFVLNMILFITMIYCPIKSKKVLMNQFWYFTIMSIAYACWFILRNGLDAFDEGKLGTLEEGVNSNTIGKVLCYLAAIILAHFLINNLKGKIIHLSLLLISVFLLFLTGSRTSLVAFVITAVICILYWMRLNSQKIGLAIVILSVAILGLYFVYNYLLEILPDLMGRFTFESIFADGGTGRLDVWEAYFTYYFPNYWLFGIGFDPLNLFYGIQRVNGIGHGAHNIIIDILASAGLVGLMLYSTMFYKGYKECFKLTKKDISVLIPFAMLTASLTVGIGENVLRGRVVWVAIALIVLWKKLNNAEKV